MLSKLFSGDTCERDVLQDDPGQVIEWWESRRLFFNIVVGSTGIVTCIAMVAQHLLRGARLFKGQPLRDQRQTRTHMRCFQCIFVPRHHEVCRRSHPS